MHGREVMRLSGMHSGSVRTAFVAMVLGYSY